MSLITPQSLVYILLSVISLLMTHAQCKLTPNNTLQEEQPNTITDINYMKHKTQTTKKLHSNDIHGKYVVNQITLN